MKLVEDMWSCPLILGSYGHVAVQNVQIWCENRIDFNMTH